MTVRYSKAADVHAIAVELLHHHPHLTENGHVRIEYVFRSEHAVSAGVSVWGRARKVTGLNAWLASDNFLDEEIEDVEPFFVIEIAEDIWTVLTGPQRRALVDHELSHCKVEMRQGGEARLSIVGHDVEDFEQILRRHGLWRADLESFIKVGADHMHHQLSLVDS